MVADFDLGAVRARVVTVSDRCSRGSAVDVSGPTAAAGLTALGLDVDDVVVVPDGVASVQAAIRAAMAEGVRLVFTTGGTGITLRDETPEATEPLLDVRLDGVAAQIRARGEGVAPAAVLSRGLVGLIGRGPDAALVVNAPGSPGGAKDAVAVLAPILGHVFGQLEGSGH